MPSTVAKCVVRELAPTEQGCFAPILDSWLRPDASISATDDCPLLLGRRARALRMVAECDGMISAHAALFVQRLRTPMGLLRVGVIGAVATDPAQRGRGLASQVLRRLQDEARARSIDVLVLWATQPGLYERAGFVRAGCEWLALLPAAIAPDAGPRIRRATERDIAALMRLHDAEPVGTLRSIAHWEELLRIPAMTLLVHARTAGVPDAYAVCGKGHDLQGCIHEWAGVPEAVLALARACFALDGRDNIVLMGGPHQHKTMQLIAARGVPIVHGALGMLQALNPADLFARCGGATPSTTAPAEVTLFGLNTTPGLMPLYFKGFDSM